MRGRNRRYRENSKFAIGEVCSKISAVQAALLSFRKRVPGIVYRVFTIL